MHVDLPPFILVHAVGMVALGLKLLFFDRRERTALGIATVAIGACCEQSLFCRIPDTRLS